MIPNPGPGKEGGSKINRKRKSRESFSSDSSLPDANQNKKMMRMPKRRTSQPLDSKSSQIVENGEVQEASVHDTAYGQSDSGVKRSRQKPC